MVPLATWSNAPTASTERTVARGLASVAARSRRLTASVPNRVLKPNWCFKHADWKWGAKCCARARPRRRRSTSPTTSARTRPLGFRRATRRPTRRPSKTTEGTSACASRRAAPCNRRLSSSSSRGMRKCSLVAPEGPAAEPRLALRRHSRKAS